MIEPIGPPPFRFELAGGTLEGPAFSIAFKVIASCVVFGTAAWFARLWMAGTLGSITWFGAAMALMLYTWWCVMRSRTKIDAQGLHQSWIIDKNMELRELAYGKIVRVRGLDWLIAPRLYVRTLMGKFAVFYAADPKMIAEFERLVFELKAFRGFK